MSNNMIESGSPVYFSDDRGTTQHRFVSVLTKHKIRSARVNCSNGKSYLVPLAKLWHELDEQRCQYKHPDWVKKEAYGIVDMLIWHEAGKNPSDSMPARTRPVIELIVGIQFFEAVDDNNDDGVGTTHIPF